MTKAISGWIVRHVSIKSWRTVIFALMATILLFMVGFVFALGEYYYQHTLTTFHAENMRSVQNWSVSVQSRLTALSAHIHELMIMIYDSTELRNGTNVMPYDIRQKCIDMMEAKQRVSSDVTGMFIHDMDSDLMLFSTGIGQLLPQPSHVLQIKHYLREAELHPTNISDREWYLAEIAGTAYFIRSVKLGKYVVGALSAVQRFEIEDMMAVRGGTYSCMFAYLGRIIHVNGQDWSDRVRFNAGGSLVWEIGNIDYATAQLDLLNADIILAVKKIPRGELLPKGANFLLVFGIACIGMFIMLILVMARIISRPTRAMLKGIQEIKHGNLGYHMSEQWGSAEFNTLSSSFNGMVDQIKNLRIAVYDQDIQKQHNELTMLRAQIRPHFFLNAITTVSNMTYQKDSTAIRAYLSALAQYMRYMLNLRSKVVPLGIEISHIRNYLKMQMIKFPDSVQAEVICSERLEKVEIPYLLLFTVVENTFKHAMDLYHMLLIRIQCESVDEAFFTGCRITVEDNGAGFSQEVLNLFQPGVDLPEAKDHLGLTNASRTLQLVYHRNDLLRISNTQTHGARVELLIPDQALNQAGDRDNRSGTDEATHM